MLTLSSRKANGDALTWLDVGSWFSAAFWTLSGALMPFIFQTRTYDTWAGVCVFFTTDIDAQGDVEDLLFEPSHLEALC